MIQYATTSDSTKDNTAYRNILSAGGSAVAEKILTLRSSGSTEGWHTRGGVYLATSDKYGITQGTEQEAQDLAAQFHNLANKWKDETALMSSITQIARHPAYQRIIGMGPKVIPLILEELQQDPDQWFWALNALTGENPVPKEAEGNLSKMAEAWIRWGRAHHYVD